jgi:hypothetical protein
MICLYLIVRGVVDHQTMYTGAEDTRVTRATDSSQIRGT